MITAEEWTKHLGLTPIEEAAWSLYCDEAKGMLSAKDFWHELNEQTKKRYLDKINKERYIYEPTSLVGRNNSIRGNSGRVVIEGTE